MDTRNGEGKAMNTTTKQPTTERVCTNHCGHADRFFNDGVCGWYPTRDGYAGNVCGHVCTFSEPATKPITKEEVDTWQPAKRPEEFAYFRILKPSGFENTIIEARCGDCAGDAVAKLVLGPGPYWDGYMEGIDYDVINARSREDLSSDKVVVFGPSVSGCPFCESAEDDAVRERVPGLPERHEYQQYKQTPYCGFSLSTTPGHRCGQPKDAAVHQKDEAIATAKFDGRSVDPRTVPEKWLSDVKFFDHIQGASNICTWQCGVCFQTWDSSAKLPCPRCRPNWKNELAALLLEKRQIADEIAQATRESLGVEAQGTMKCPICGVDSPHTHGEEEVDQYRWGQGVRKSCECGCCPTGDTRNPSSVMGVWCRCACHDVADYVPTPAPTSPQESESAASVQAGPRKIDLCKHCGSTATAMQNPETKRWWIECDGCGVSTPTDNFSNPYEVWNARTTPTPAEPSVEAAARYHDALRVTERDLEQSQLLLTEAIFLVSKIGTSGIDATTCRRAEKWLENIARLEEKMAIK